MGIRYKLKEKLNLKMKLFGFTLAAVALAQSNDTFVPVAAAAAARSYGVELTGATCYKCEGDSYEACIAQANEREGGAVSCRSDKMCSITERRRGGEIERVEMRCKKDENGAEVPSVCRKCFGQDKDVDFIEGFIRGVGYADSQGANGLLLDHWMTE